MLFKKKVIPNPEENLELKAVQLWEVRWMGTEVGHYRDRPEMESFTCRLDARSFSDSLKNAHKLLKNRGDLDIRITKQEH